MCANHYPAIDTLYLWRRGDLKDDQVQLSDWDLIRFAHFREIQVLNPSLAATMKPLRLEEESAFDVLSEPQYENGTITIDSQVDFSRLLNMSAKHRGARVYWTLNWSHVQPREFYQWLGEKHRRKLLSLDNLHESTTYLLHPKQLRYIQECGLGEMDGIRDQVYDSITNQPLEPKYEFSVISEFSLILTGEAYPMELEIARKYPERMIHPLPETSSKCNYIHDWPVLARYNKDWAISPFTGIPIASQLRCFSNLSEMMVMFGQVIWKDAHGEFHQAPTKEQILDEANTLYLFPKQMTFDDCRKFLNKDYGDHRVINLWRIPMYSPSEEKYRAWEKAAVEYLTRD